MREIKFRAKATHNNQWYYGAYYEHINRKLCPFGDEEQKEDIEPIIITSGFADWNLPRPLQRVDVNSETVCQYTGIKDKNGKEIYEGDIIKVKSEFQNWNKNNDDMEDKIDTLTYVINFGKYDQDGSGDEYEPSECLGFYADLIEKNYASEYEYTTSILELSNLEVVGNIYENPELLEDEGH